MSAARRVSAARILVQVVGRTGTDSSRVRSPMKLSTTTIEGSKEPSRGDDDDDDDVGEGPVSRWQSEGDVVIEMESRRGSVESAHRRGTLSSRSRDEGRTRCR